MKICSVGGCGLSSQDILMFDFPTSRILRKRWLDVINAEKKIAHDDAICIHHFKVDDYDVVRGVTRLKAKVVPSVFGEAVLPGRNHDPSGKTGKETNKKEGTNKEEEANKKEAANKEEEGSIKSTKNDNDNGNSDNDKDDSDNDKDDLDNDKDDLDNDKDDLDNETHNTVNKNGNEDNDGEYTKNETSANGNITDKDRDSGEESSKSVDEETTRKEISSPDKNLQENGNRTTNHDTVKDNEDNHTVRDNDNHTVRDNDNHKVRDNDNETVRDNKNNKPVSKPKRVRKKWVPMRKDPRGNGKVELSEDSSSQDSVNSDLPAPPVLEDLEEHLPNYQIANMKTERQVAAMTLTEDPVQEPSIDQDIEEMVITPHVPVFIELAVGRDNPESTANNDCVMVVESVQCDVDPTLMLEARLEDEDCWEQIDIDDDDEDDVMDTTPEVDEKKKTSKKKPPKKPKPSADPISLLTSSDEDDVIIQEPHIDTLSVSDETDEDDLPLQKLIKREKKNKKNKKATKTNKKPENLNEVFVGIKDYFCMHCGNISTNRGEHDNHIKTHVTERTPTRARIYEICKECGFTSASKSQLNRHMRKHLNEKKYKCSLCTYRSKYNMSLLYHLKTHEDPNKYNCGSCGLKLEAKKELVEHQKSCSEMDDKFMCSTCGYIARSKRDLKVHRSRVHKK